MSKKPSFLKNKEITNSFWIIGERVFQLTLTLFVSIFTARYLGPDNFGTLNYAASFVAFISSVATLGMEGVVIKKMIAAPACEGEYLGSCMLFRFISSILSTIAISVLVFVLNPDEPLKLLLVLIQSTQLAFRSVQILDSWFQRHLKSKYVSIGKMAACVVVNLYKIILLVTARDIVWFAVSNVLTDAVISLVLWIFYRRESQQKLRCSFSEGWEVLHESYHFILSGLMVGIYGQMDKIMIGQMMSDTDVGLYTTATTICGLWIFVPQAIIKSFQPKIMELKNSGQEKQYLFRLEQLYSAIIWLCIVCSAFISLLAPLIVLILYGKAYMGAVGALRIAIWLETFSMIGTARGIWILCENKNKYVKYMLGIGAGVNLILNTVLIPTYGIDGAAFATLVTQFVTSIVAPLCFRGTRIHTRIVWDAFVFGWYFRSKSSKDSNQKISG